MAIESHLHRFTVGEHEWMVKAGGVVEDERFALLAGENVTLTIDPREPHSGRFPPGHERGQRVTPNPLGVVRERAAHL